MYTRCAVLDLRRKVQLTCWVWACGLPAAPSPLVPGSSAEQSPAFEYSQKQEKVSRNCLPDLQNLPHFGPPRGAGEADIQSDYLAA